MSNPLLHTMQGQACANDPELWFMTTKAAVREAKKFCAECPIKEMCLENGLIPVFPDHHSSGLPYGIWGGATKDERDAILKERKRLARQGTDRLFPFLKDGAKAS